MPSLQTSGSSRFETEFRHDDGRRFLGVIDVPTNREPPGNQFTSPRRLLKARPEALVQIGDVIITPAGVRFLVAANGDGLDGDTPIYRSYRLFQMDRQVDWSRISLIIDPVTRQERESGSISLGTLWCCFEPLREDNDRVFRVREDRQRMITGADLKLNDQVGPYVVKRVDHLLGVTVAEVQ